jgi:hypothetical protein
MFALDDSGHLYGLSPDGSGVFSYNGKPMEWTQIGGPAGNIYAGGGSLFATNPDTGDIYKYQGTPWSWIRAGGPGKMFAVDTNGKLYGVSPGGAGLYSYDDAANAWTRIADQASAVYAGGSNVYATMGSSSEVYRYNNVPLDWTKIGGQGKMFAVDDAGNLYRLSLDGKEVTRYEIVGAPGSEWTKVGDAAGKIFAGGSGEVFATDPKTSDLYTLGG